MFVTEVAVNVSASGSSWDQERMFRRELQANAAVHNLWSVQQTTCYITLHYITLHYITLHYITLHYITLHYITLHYITRL